MLRTFLSSVLLAVSISQTATAATNVSVNIDGQSFSCSAGGGAVGEALLESEVDVACLKSLKERSYSVTVDMVKNWANNDCRTTITDGQCRVVAQKPNRECADMVISWWYSPNASLISEIHQLCKTKIVKC